VTLPTRTITLWRKFDGLNLRHCTVKLKGEVKRCPVKFKWHLFGYISSRFHSALRRKAMKSNCSIGAYQTDVRAYFSFLLQIGFCWVPTSQMKIQVGMLQWQRKLLWVLRSHWSGWKFGVEQLPSLQGFVTSSWRCDAKMYLITFTCFLGVGHFWTLQEYQDRLRTIALRKERPGESQWIKASWVMPSSLIKSFTSPWQEGLEKAEIAESIGRPAKFVQTWWRKEPKEVPKPAGEPRQHHFLVNFEEIW